MSVFQMIVSSFQFSLTRVYLLGAALNIANKIHRLLIFFEMDFPVYPVFSVNVIVDVSS